MGLREQKSTQNQVWQARNSAQKVRKKCAKNKIDFIDYQSKSQNKENKLKMRKKEKNEHSKHTI